MEHSEHSPEKEVHSNTGLPQEARRISTSDQSHCSDQSNTTPKRTRKMTTNKAQSKYEGNNQDQNENQ